MEQDNSSAVPEEVKDTAANDRTIVYEYAIIKGTVEAYLFLQTKPASVSHIAQVLAFETTDVKKALNELMKEYEARAAGIILNNFANGYQLSTNPLYKQQLEKVYTGPPRPRLTPITLDVLAIIAYQQPVTRQEIEDLRSHGCGSYLKLLLELDLIQIAGRKDIPGRPFLYATTAEFLNYFGLKGLKELPNVDEIKALELE